jgi:hypothetical protein
MQGYRVAAITNCGRLILLVLSSLSPLHIITRLLFSPYITGYAVQEPGSHLAPEARQGLLLLLLFIQEDK